MRYQATWLPTLLMQCRRKQEEMNFWYAIYPQNTCSIKQAVRGHFKGRSVFVAFVMLELLSFYWTTLWMCFQCWSCQEKVDGQSHRDPAGACCPCYQLAQVSVLTLGLKKAICNTAGVTSGWEVFETNGLISSFNIPVVLAGLAAMEFNKIDDRQPVRALNSVALIPGFKHDSGILRLPRQCNPHPKYSPVFQGTPADMQQQVMLTYR